MTEGILFIHPGHQPASYQGLAEEFTAVAPPVWTALLAQHARRQGLDVTVYDANVDGWDATTAASILGTHDPRLVVMMVYGHNPSASTQTMPAAGRIARDIKRINPDLPLAMGGLHPSALPARTLREEAVDYVIRGEGPGTIVSLCRHLSGDVPLREVSGLWYRERGTPQSTPPPPSTRDLDETLGDYAWDLLPPLDKYRAHTMHCFQRFENSKKENFSDVRSPYATIYTSLGCPYTCDYCAIHALSGQGPVRYWSLENIASRIDNLVNRHGVKNIRIEDELFILSPQRVESFCDLLIARGYDLNLWVYGRVDTIRKSLLKKMKRAGMNWICLGIESASERVRKDVGKVIRADIKKVVASIRDQGIHVLGNFMFGLPEDDLATMEETFALARDLQCEYVNFYTVMAYPGSVLYERHVQDGCLPESWAGYSQLGYDTRPLPTRHLSSAAVLRFRDRAFRAYFTDAGYLAMMRGIFGPKVVKHLQEMAALPLRRRLLEEEDSE